MTSTPAAEPPHRRTLDNGLRVVLAPRWPTPRAAVSVHYGVGFRSELPGQEGFAHLFEHLMYRGSESLPEGGYFTGLVGQAGTADGTTHQDYTDYVQGVPAAGLEQFLLILQKARDWNDGQARKRLLAAFATLDDADLVGRYRRKMASLLF